MTTEDDGSIRFQVKVTAVGEVRDSEGNLISAEPVEAVTELTQAQLVELGIPVPERKRQ